MKTNSRIPRGFTLVELLVVIVIIAALAGLTAPMIIKQARKADAAEALSNARQIGMAMFSFQAEYSSYPDADTEKDVDKAGGYTLGTANSNNYFQQLFAAGMCESEAMFFAKVKDSRKPDGNITGAEALAAGECGFGYVLDTADGLTASGNPSRILAACPLLAASATEFDIDPFDKKAILLRIDNSVTSAPIVDKKAMSSTKADAVDLFEGKDKDTIWGADITPTIIPPSPVS